MWGQLSLLVIYLTAESDPGVLLQVREHYCHVPVYVMANGVQEDPARFIDSLRVYYLYNYINEALKGETCAPARVWRLVASSHCLKM